MSCPLEKYRDVFGAPGTGVHKYRFLGVALVDFALSVLGAVLISVVFKMPIDLSLILVLVLGIILHALFGVPAGALKFLGIKC
jgi:hypothetical protein